MEILELKKSIKLFSNSSTLFLPITIGFIEIFSLPPNSKFTQGDYYKGKNINKLKKVNVYRLDPDKKLVNCLSPFRCDNGIYSECRPGLLTNVYQVERT